MSGVILPFEDLGFAKVDHHRSLRNGLPEVIYGKGKTKDQLISIINSLHKAKNDVLVTKLGNNEYKSVKKKIPIKHVYDDISMTLVLNKSKRKKKVGNITIVSAGTSDIPIAEEARMTTEVFGNKTEKL